MELRIRRRDGELPPSLRRAIERRIRLALGRYAPRIGVARVTLSQGARDVAGGTTFCRIRVRFREGAVLEVEEPAGDPEAAASRAAWRLEHRLERERGRRVLGPRVA